LCVTYTLKNQFGILGSTFFLGEVSLLLCVFPGQFGINFFVWIISFHFTLFYFISRAIWVQLPLLCDFVYF